MSRRHPPPEQFPCAAGEPACRPRVVCARRARYSPVVIRLTVCGPSIDPAVDAGRMGGSIPFTLAQVGLGTAALVLHGDGDDVDIG